MTELMKRYEAETGKKFLYLYTMMSSDAVFHLGKQEIWLAFIELLEFNQWLAEQLTWRPVTQKPEKEGWYLCKVEYVDDTIGEETVFFNGEHFVSSDVIKWLPIPPAPEGE